MTTKTLREQYNERIGSNVLDELFKAIKLVQRMITLITAIAMVVSYWHQKEFFSHLGAGKFAYVLPLTLDALMIALIKISQLKGIPEANRSKARKLLLVPALASMAINFAADGHLILRGFFAFVVVAIMVGDYAHSLIKPDFSEIEKAAVELAPVERIDASEIARRAARRETDRARRAARRLAEQRAAEEAAARKALAAERRRETLTAKKAAASELPVAASVAVPAQPVHVVVPTRPRVGAFGLPRQPLRERLAVLSGSAG